MLAENQEVQQVDKMKNKILIGIFAFLMIILSTVVYADVPVDYALREATVLDSGDISYSTNSITDVNAIGFVCADEDCNDVTGTLWNGEVQTSGNSDILQLVYPTDLPESGYYAVFFYKEGYIPYGIKAYWHGNSGVQSSTAYLSKKDVGRAPIDSFDVLNDVQPNVPLVMAIDSSLDGSTYAALSNSGYVGYRPSELEEYHSVETRISLKVYDDNDNVVYEDEQTVNIPYSGSERVEFTWTPEESGDYRVVATTFVTDSKFLTSEEQEVNSEFHVLEEDPNDMCYTLLNGLKVSNQFPRAGETVTISGNKISNYADENYVLTAVSTNLALEVADNSGAVVYSDTLTTNPNDNVVDKESFEFEWIPDQEGWHTILVTGIGSQCLGKENLAETERVIVYVSGAAPASAPVLQGIPNQAVDEGEEFNAVDLWNYAADRDTADEDLRFNVVSQSNEDLTVCSINSNRNVECTAPDGYGYSDVAIEVSDGQYTDRDSFKLIVNKVTEYPIIGNIPNVELRQGGSVSFDLDDYVNDDDLNSELSWNVVSTENVKVAIDSRTHVATITTRNDEWDGQENVAFIVTDTDGLTDSDNCMVTVLSRLDERAEKNELTISRILTSDIVGDNILQLNIRLDNTGNQDLKNIVISAMVLEFDSYDTEGPFDLKDGKQATKSLILVLPEDVEPGYYYVRVSVNSNNVRRIVYREVIIE